MRNMANPIAFTSRRLAAAGLAALLLLGACSPRYNWREASDNGTHFVVLLPAKPATASRTINLDGTQVEMTMVAAEVDGTTFAVATAELPDAGLAKSALEAMRTALLNNISGKPREAARIPGKTDGFSAWLDVDADGAVQGKPLRMVARLAARDKRIFQILIMGNGSGLADENIETFFNAFKPI